MLDDVPARDRVETVSLRRKVAEIAGPDVDLEVLARVACRLGAVVDPERLPAAPLRDGEEEARAATDVEQAAGGAHALERVEPTFVELTRGLSGASS